MMRKKLITVVLFFAVSTASASPSKNVIDTDEAITKGLSVFTEMNEQGIVDLFRGVRGEPKDGGVVVKVYLKNGENQEYGCHRHEDSDPYECHITN